MLSSSEQLAARALGLFAVLGSAAIWWGGAACSSWRPSSPVCLSGAQLGPAGTCRAQRAPEHRIPFPAGYETQVLQGYHGYRTHKKDLAYSVDFKCESGTPIVATRSGVVWAIREGSDHGCDDPSCVDEGNYVALDHGNGTFTEYHHLQQFGATVEVGDQVCRGEVIGLCGNTGYSSGPHLHFAVTDLTHRTVPSRVSAPNGERFPFFVPEKTYVSHNERAGPCPETEDSELPADAFVHQGILLDDSLPMVVERGETRTELVGTYHGEHPKIAVHRQPLSGGDWIDECVEVDEDGRFRAILEWPREELEAGFYWFMLTGADEECLAPGWAWSYEIRVD